LSISTWIVLWRSLCFGGEVSAGLDYTDKLDPGNCPVSSQIDTVTDNLWSYPLDMFAPELAEQVRNQTHGDRYRRCISHHVQHDKVMSCVAQPAAVCPVASTYVDASRKRMQGWNMTNNICRFAKALHNAPTEFSNPRIIVFGGSVTVGAQAEGCYCDPAIDSGCKLPDSSLHNQQRCPWSLYIQHWVSKTFRGKNVTVHTIAVQGWSIRMMTQGLNLMMENAGLSGFKGDDLVILDHSYNDLIYMNEREIMFAYVCAMSRQILTRSENNSWPTIVLTVHYSTHFEHGDIFEPYERVARLFGSPLWSIRDFVATQVPVGPHHEEGFLPTDLLRRHLMGHGYRDHHPPWMVHLFVADLYAASLLRDLEQCKAANYATTMPAADMVPAKIPVKKSVLDPCDADCMVVGLNAFAPQTFNEVSISHSKHSRWFFGEDRPGKKGWIAKLTDHENQTLVEEEMELTSSIFFSFKKPQDFAKHSWFLKIFMLKTYHQAGKLQLHLCGYPLLPMLDTLWSIRVSVPEMEYYRIDGATFPAEAVEKNCSSTFVVQADHIVREHYKVRQSNKVKIVGLEMCRIE
jgi:hypothetical protein